MQLARDLIYDRRQPGYDPLFKFLERFNDKVADATGPAAESGTLEERLQRRIIDGKKIGIDKLLEVIGLQVPQCGCHATKQEHHGETNGQNLRAYLHGPLF